MDRPIKGYMGKFLRVDLSSGKIKTGPLPEELINKYIGGRGFGAKILYDELEAGVGPLSPANKMIFLSGPLAGTAAQSCSRWMIVTKSPQTGGYFRSVSGGAFGAELKSAGFDVLIVEGASERPCYLWITDDRAEIRDAENLLGLLCGETTTAICKELNDDKIKVVNIGPSAEKMVRFSGIYNDQRMAARGGAGMVMWSKKLKAIAVRGNKKVEAADHNTLVELSKAQYKRLQDNPRFKAFTHVGTASGIGGCHPLGILPVKNFRDGVLKNVERLAAEKMEDFFVKDALCHRCHIRCGRILQIKEGPYAGKAVKGPEYEALYSLGATLGNTSHEMVVAGNHLCDEYGADVISAGVTIAFAMECYEKGILTKDDLDGIDLTWGDTDSIYELLKKILTRDGIGDLLAEGSKIAAKKIGKGAEKFAMHVKGLEIGGYDPRSLKGSGLNFSTISFGANHTAGQCPQEMMPPGMGGVDRFSAKNKGALCKMNQTKIATVETGIMCIFPKSMGLVPESEFAKMLSAATGVEEFSDVEYIYEAAERILMLERAFNIREGFSRKDDRLPSRFLNESPEHGKASGQKFEMETMLDDYYEAWDWEKTTGYPKREALEDMGLKPVADELQNLRKLAGAQL